MLACYGCALQYETSEYYKDLKGSDYTATYYMWIIGSAALNVCLTIIICKYTKNFNSTKNNKSGPIGSFLQSDPPTGQCCQNCQPRRVKKSTKTCMCK